MTRGGARSGAGRKSKKEKSKAMNNKLGRVIVPDIEVSAKNAFHDALKKFQTIMRKEEIGQNDAMALKSVVSFFNYFLAKLEKSESRVTEISHNTDIKALMLGTIRNDPIIEIDSGDNLGGDGERIVLTRYRSKSIHD